MAGNGGATATRLLSTQRAINSHLAAVEPPETLVPGVIESICETLDWSFGAFWAPHDDDGEEALRTSAIWHRPSPLLDEFAESCRAVRLRRGEGLLGTIWETGEPAWLPDLQAVRLPRSELAVPAGLRGVFAFPLALEDRLAGIVEFISEEEREPEPELVDNFQVVGMQLAHYLERWRERRARDSRRVALLDAALDCIVTMDHRGVVLEFNPAAERTFGYSHDEAIGRELADLIVPPSLRAAHRAGLRRLAESGGRAESRIVGHRVEMPAMRADGTEIPVELSVTRVDAAGEAVFTSFIRDLTDRRRAEEEQRRLALIVESSDDAIVSKDRNLIIQSWNAGAQQLYGYTAEEAIGRSVRMLIPGDRLGQEVEILEHVMQGGTLRQYETKRIRKDGRGVDVSLTVSPVRDSDGSIVGVSVIARDITERLASEAAVARLAYHDQLTDLANRTLLEEHLEVALARARREHRDVALLYLDLDNFKMVNDSLGHGAGDRVLQMVAERLVSITRASDLVARHGGDEFLILLTDLQDGSQQVAEAVAGKILAALEEPFTIGEAEFEIGASVGIAIFPRDAHGGSELLRAADTAMYQAKAAGRGRYAVHRVRPYGDRDPLSTTARLRRALVQDEFVLHYQPIYTVPDRRLTAVEALLRWNDPARGLVGPGDFILLAEDTGLIEPIGEWVIQAICRQAVEWQELGLDVRIHFNLSPRQLRQGKATEAIREMIEAGGVSPAMLTAEITESAAMAQAEGGHSMLAELRQLGLHVSVDDFGSGYSSLGRLRELPVDELKLDRSFLVGVPHDPDAGALVRGVIDLASGLGMDTVVEGVETAAQWRFLGDRGNLLAQGFHLARPAPAGEVTRLLHEARQTA